VKCDGAEQLFVDALVVAKLLLRTSPVSRSEAPRVTRASRGGLLIEARFKVSCNQSVQDLVRQNGIARVPLAIIRRGDCRTVALNLRTIERMPASIS
jgi:hypothetical protein